MCCTFALKNIVSHSHVRLKITLSIRCASRLLCACARFARSLMSSLSHSLFCLALSLLRLRLLCACSRSVRSLKEVFLFLSRFALLLVAPACVLHVHSEKIVSHSLFCLALALRLHSLCALAQDYSLTRYALALGRARVFSARSLENFSLLIALLCACAHIARSLMSCLSHSLLCLALTLSLSMPLR